MGRFVYCIFYIERKYIDNIQEQLDSSGFTDLKAIVPMVKVLRKSAKGKMIFVEEPVLFNYGFIKMPTELAYSRPFLRKVQKQIPGIHHWLKSNESLHPKKKRMRIDSSEDFDDFSLVATCPKSDVKRFVNLAKENNNYTMDDLVKLKPGNLVQLKGYPYEGMNAKVLYVDFEEKIVTLTIHTIKGLNMELRLPFDNVIYSVYRNYDADTIYASYLDKNPNDITQDSIDSILDRKQY